MSAKVSTEAVRKVAQWRSEDGTEAALALFEDAGAKTRKQLGGLLSTVATDPNLFTAPYVKECKPERFRGLYEARAIQKSAYRLIFCFHNGMALLLHAYMKGRGRTAERALETARKRASDARNGFAQIEILEVSENGKSICYGA
jgi:phage-related protein